MNTKNLKLKALLGTVIAAGALVIGADAKSDTAQTGGGVQAVYGNIPADQVEFLSTPDRIISMSGSGAPTAIWQTLEHGESVQCMECIGAVAPLLYDPLYAKNREIAAWWLRKRVFGIFGPGEVYEQTVNTLASDPSAQRRGFAASALGEFLDGAGIAPLAAAAIGDSDPGVRASAMAALGRINDDGSGALTHGLIDSDTNTQIAAMEAAGRVSTISDANFIPQLTTVLGSSNALVRKHAVQLLDEMDVVAADAAVLALAKGDSDENVRLNACHALGTFGNAADLATLQYIAANDSSTLVQDMANIALLRL
jgi:HEAT repeat protein